jgi:hypothetical protein
VIDRILSGAFCAFFAAMSIVGAVTLKGIEAAERVKERYSR